MCCCVGGGEKEEGDISFFEPNDTSIVGNPFEGGIIFYKDDVSRIEDWEFFVEYINVCFFYDVPIPSFKYDIKFKCSLENVLLEDDVNYGTYNGYKRLLITDVRATYITTYKSSLNKNGDFLDFTLGVKEKISDQIIPINIMELLNYQG
jgi:hypothetical protein